MENHISVVLMVLLAFCLRANGELAVTVSSLAGSFCLQ